MSTEEWTVHTVEGETFYHNAKTGESATDPTDPLTFGHYIHERVPVTEDSIVPLRTWVKSFSKTQQRYYWTDTSSGLQTWTNPRKRSAQDPILLTAAKVPVTESMRIHAKIEAERRSHAVTHPLCSKYPRLINKVDLPHLIHRLRTECAEASENYPEFSVVFTLKDDETGLVTRAIQEDQILKTRLKVRQFKSVVDLPSFWENWQNLPDFREQVLSAPDPYEATWQLQMKFNYKLATTFMPAYAKAIYEFFGARRVLDPCAGWGDRLTGATVAKCVEHYVAFDPNLTLRSGYTDIMQSLGHQLTRCTESSLHFSNDFHIHTLPFEVGAVNILGDIKYNGYFDLVFTSPPFFDYEMYADTNPQYASWIDEFYRPLFEHSARCVKDGGYVCIHIGDTSAGNIEKFLQEEVHQFCALRLEKKIGLRGMVSNKIRTVWLFRKQMR